MWMAETKGLYKEAGLEVTFRIFPSGTTASRPSRPARAT
jgi:hypothetical protein